MFRQVSGSPALVMWSVGVISLHIWKEKHRCSWLWAGMAGHCAFVQNTCNKDYGYASPRLSFPVVLPILILQAVMDSPWAVNTTLDSMSFDMGSYGQPIAGSSAMRRVQSMSNFGGV